MTSLRSLLLALMSIGWAAPVAATLNDSEEPGSVLVFHKFIRGTFADTVSAQALHARTEFEISVVCPKGATCARNPITGKFEKVFLRGHWVCPDCSETSFDLVTTINGTLYFNPEGVTVVAGLVSAAAYPSNATTPISPPPCPRGYLIVWATDGSGTAIKFDGLIGDAVIRDGSPGAESFSARSYNPIPIQAGPDIVAADGSVVFTTGLPTDLNSNGALDFDGTEYMMLTGKIFGTVRYESNMTGASANHAAQTDLTLLTLDVASSRQNPVTTVGLNFYTPDEDLIDTSTAFGCWTEKRLTEINSGLTIQRMGRKGLVESTFAQQQLDFFTFKDVSLLGIVETKEGVLTGTTFSQFRDYSYSLYNDSEPVVTTFTP